jgi:hypothetical protein
MNKHYRMTVHVHGEPPRLTYKSHFPTIDDAKAYLETLCANLNEAGHKSEILAFEFDLDHDGADCAMAVGHDVITYAVDPVAGPFGWTEIEA